MSVQPPKKKQRKSEDTEDSDAKLAAMLQAQENRMGRSTRGGGSKASKPKLVKKKPRKKSSNKVKPEDDSDVDGSEGSTAKPRKAGGGFQKPFNLSAPLSELCGGEARVSHHIPSPPHTAPGLADMPASFPGPRSSRSCGSTSSRTSSKTRAISARSAATT